MNKSNLIAIGDGTNDISMFKQVEHSFAFGASDVVKVNARYSVGKDFKEIINILDNTLFVGG